MPQDIFDVKRPQMREVTSLNQRPPGQSVNNPELLTNEAIIIKFRTYEISPLHIYFKNADFLPLLSDMLYNDS